MKEDSSGCPVSLKVFGSELLRYAEPVTSHDCLEYILRKNCEVREKDCEGPTIGHAVLPIRGGCCSDIRLDDRAWFQNRLILEWKGSRNGALLWWRRADADLLEKGDQDWWLSQ